MKRCVLLDHIAQTRYSIHEERSEMRKVQATAEVFITAFMHLPRPQRGLPFKNKLKITESAERELREFHKKLQDRIVYKILKLGENPRLSGSKNFLELTIIA